MKVIKEIEDDGTVQGCAKCMRTTETCNETECRAEYREDGRNVYFVEVEEPDE